MLNRVSFSPALGVASAAGWVSASAPAAALTVRSVHARASGMSRQRKHHRANP